MYSLRFHKQIALDIRNARNWYNEEKLGLGNDLERSIFSCFEFIKSNPQMCPKRYNKVRIRKVNKTFPYYIHYEVNTKSQEIMFWGVFHGKRNPKKWQKRVKGSFK